MIFILLYINFLATHIHSAVLNSLRECTICGGPGVFRDAQIAIWRVFRRPQIVNQRVPNLWGTYALVSFSGQTH